MIIFSKKKVASDTLGERLKKIREKLGISLDEISQATKIRKQHLEFIEDNKFEKLPPDVYVKGFLKSYANFLRIEPTDVIRFYEKEKGIKRAYKKLKKKSKNKRSLPVITITPRWVALFVSFLLIFVGVVYFYQEVSRFSKTPSLVITHPLDKTIINNSSVKVSGIAEKRSQILINEQPVAVNQAGEFYQTINLQPGLNQLEIKAINKFNRSITKKISLVVEDDHENVSNKEQLAEGVVMGEKDSLYKEGLHMEITAGDNPVWISISVDEQPYQQETLLAGSTKKVEAQDKIMITSGKANQTFIKLNGQDLGMLDKSPGVIREVAFTKETLKNLENKSNDDKNNKRQNDSAKESKKMEEAEKEQNNN